MKIYSSILTLTIIWTLIFGNQEAGKAQTLSPQAEISLLTCSPGKELHTLFGHSAIRVKDTVNKWDWVFNYGTFDFSTPNFYLKFAQRNLEYMLSISRFDSFRRVYIREQRNIYQQQLNLDSLSKQKLFQALLVNYRPENRYYRYDFLFDNCSSRVRDVIEDNVEETINFSSNSKTSSKSFRDLMKPYVKENRWIDLGINLLLGKPSDNIATPYQYMFLPDHLMEAFALAELGSSGKKRPLAQKSTVIYKAPAQNNHKVWYTQPLTLFCLLAIIILAYTIEMYRRRKYVFWHDALIFTIIGLLGWVIFFMWFLSDHKATDVNLNIFWAFPLHFPMALWLMRKRRPKWIKYYFFVQSILLLTIIGGLPLIPQNIPLTLLPLLSALLLRSLFIYKYYINKEN